MRQVWVRHLFLQAQLRLLRVRLAVYRYQLQKSKPPAILQDLVPAYLPELPLDPFAAAAALRYHNESPEPVIYSIGLDEVDDGGIVPTNRVYGGLHFPPLRDYRGDVGLARLAK